MAQPSAQWRLLAQAARVTDGMRALEVSSAREWLEAHGDGSFALGTISGALTRRYHGWLVAATPPPAGRAVLLSKVDELATANGAVQRLSSNVFVAGQHDGTASFESFTAVPFPTWTLRVGEALLERTIVAAHGEATTLVRYRWLEGPPIELELRPMLAMRPFHHVRRGSSIHDFQVDARDDFVSVTTHGVGAVHLSHDGHFDAAPAMWTDFFLADEAARGLETTEDLFVPGTLRATLSKGRDVTVVASAHRRHASVADAIVETELERRTALLRPEASLDANVQLLTLAADRYVAKIGHRRTTIAGYPWFEDWGRDTMISMPGLLLATGKREVAFDILEAYADEVCGGLLPNRFPDGRAFPDYNTVDAALLFVEAVRLYLVYGGHPGKLEDRIYPRVMEIVTRYARGTHHGIGADDDGLIVAGSSGHALTWMDAVVNGRAITPRRGKPVEIQALWYNALLVAAELATHRGALILSGELKALATRVAQSFRARFWDESRGYLADIVDPLDGGGAGSVDARLRPNQLFAFSLGHGLLRTDERVRVVDAVKQALWTPRGLRTLAPDEPEYRARFEGGPVERDEAYHQGTVWPWLLGPYARAVVAARGGVHAARDEVRAALEPALREALFERCIGQVAEVYDGDEPRRAAGCPAQAWSVGELLRSWLEIVEGIGPEPFAATPDWSEPKTFSAWTAFAGD